MSKRITSITYDDGKVTGKWIRNGDTPTYMNTYGVIEVLYYDCSECGGTISDRYGRFPYCPWCGAKMEEQ